MIYIKGGDPQIREPEEFDCAEDVPGSAVSTCCGAPEHDFFHGLCKSCKEHCSWFDEFEELEE